jgi:murein DD-endopeptidase MepM/ murein hydrolase activator NlpD
VHGDPKDVHAYSDYGAQVLAVAGGTVVSTLDTLDDQVPGSLPDPATITLANVDGNHVVLDLGGGHYAFYAHLQKGSVTVHPGDRVHRGQVLGLLGNTGNTSAPHLHFHLMDGPSVLGSDGLPYTYGRVDLAGYVDPARWATAQDLTGVWNQGLLPQPRPEPDRFPMNLDIVDFPG